LNYKEGKEDGVSEYFDQDGHLQMKAYYKNGKEDGALEYYDKGELVNIEFWQNGILVDKN
ncbi:toxin-antitoxin system YwqK family antitoxin, partial [Flavobacteriaceae bacterium]|nr:toxin-antitoxin system YwqK family antitoxin [Flavobacteriaceae bacterium]